MKRNFWLVSSLGTGALTLALLAVQPGWSGEKADKNAVVGADQITNLGSISGTVSGPKEFKAAKVYAKNLDKNVTYMVFTEGGKYQALDLFPGNYEVRAEKNGFHQPGHSEGHRNRRCNSQRQFHPDRMEPSAPRSRCASACPLTNRSLNMTSSFLQVPAE